MLGDMLPLRSFRYNRRDPNEKRRCKVSLWLSKLNRDNELLLAERARTESFQLVQVGWHLSG